MASSLYVTYLEKEGPYIKVWGQTNRSLPMSIEKALQQMTPQFEEGLFLPSVEYFQVGPLCCAKFKDGSYYRARITSISYLMQGLVEVLFIDYGNKDVIPCVNIRTMTNLSPGLISIPPQARPFILANVTLPGWNANMELISNELRYLEFQMVPIAEIGPYVLVSLFLEKQDITTNLLAHGLVTPTPLHMQQVVIQSLIERNSPPGIPVNLSQAAVSIQPKLPPGIPQPAVAMTVPVTMATPVTLAAPIPAPMPTILTYKAMPLEHDCDYEVYVSYVSDGPCLFSVQLKKMEDQLKRLMTEINSMDLQQLEEYPLPGTVCLAQSTEDNYICRAVVTSMVDGLYKVFYVDFGNTELLSFDKLFQIPFKYVIPKVMATRFALAGIEQSTVSIEMKCAFKDFVNNKLLFMRVKPATAKSALSLCDLWDDKNRKALDMIRQVALQSYAEPVSVSRGFSQDVKVSYVYSCSRFYVQLKSKETELMQLMDMLQEVCLTSSPLSVTQTKDGYPCFALFEGDGLWYRAQILAVENSLYKVRYVDYGNEESVTIENLREPHSELILALRPQAIECCLNGYQNMEANEQRDSLLEELILEQELNMKVVEVQEGRALVDLSDSAHYNVASLLLDKIASVTSQISPLLVQDDYRIEHRKRTSPQPNFQKEREFRERKPSREFNDRNRETKQENWRQNKFSRNDDQKNDTNAFDKRDTFRRTASSNDDQWEAETNNFERQNSFQRTESRNDEDEWRDVDSKPNRTGGKRETYQHTEMRNGDHQFDKPKFYEKRDRPNRGDNQQRGGGRFNQQERQSNYRGQDSERPRRHEDNFQQKNSGRFNRNFNDHDGSGDGFRQNRRNDFKREGSEKSFSDSSEKSWKKGPKSSYNNAKNGSGFGGGGRASGFSKPAPIVSATEDEWGGSSTPAETLDLASETAQFKPADNLVGCSESVCISWFYNPTNFFCQLTKSKGDFKTMMEEIQEKYSTRKTIKPAVGQPVIAKFEEDGVLYRAVVSTVDFNSYKVNYVDYGNSAKVNSVYAIETKYMELPAQALNCALQSIGPSGAEWPNPDAYSSYFNKETFECQFIYEADGIYFVELNDEGIRISTLLLEANLAASLQPAIELDTSLLPAQQMIVVLSHVVSLSEITIELEPSLAVQASMHNLDGATETFEDTLRQYIGHFVIMFVDDVTEKGLEITLYDLTGQKLTIINPDEGAYDTVDPLCALPIYTKTLQGWVSHATANALYLQPSRFAEVLQQTLDLLYNHYETVAPEENLTPEVGTLYAVHSADTNWYRGRITDLNDKEIVVTYIDYGNSESLPVTELRMLHPRFYQPHMLAVEVFIDGVDCEGFVGQEVTVSMSYGENEWVGQIISPAVVATDPEVLKNEDVEVVQDEEVNAPPEPQPQESEPEPQPQQSEPEPQPQQIGVPVVLSHVDSPSEFYLQLVEAVEAIDFLQESLQEQIPNLTNLETPTPGVLCAAPYSVNQQWYRAQVLDADDDITTVRFIDFGNTDVLSNASTSIKTLPTDLLSVEQHARLCSLYAKPMGAEEWSSEAFSKFEEYVNSEFLSAEIIHQDEKTTYVELYADGKNVGETLKNDGFAGDLQMETENSSTGFISHLNSPSEFWIQLENSVPDLEWVAEQLSSAAGYPVLEDVAPGALCAAVFPGDDSWYRARILSNTVAGLEVIFIDYGNSCSCMSVRELPEDLIMLSPLAHKCTLQKPAGILQWSQPAGDKFREISAEGATVFNVNILTPGEKSIVQLTLDGEDISSQLLPEVKDCIVSHIDSLDSIWVVMNEDTKKLEELTEILYAAETWPEISEEVKEGDLVAALYDDGLWYRAKVLSQTEEGWEVLFVDYGNSTLTKFIRQLAEACDDKLPPLAVNCRLDVLTQTRWAEDSLDKFTELSAEGNTVFQMESAAENAIRLYLNGRDIRLDIGTVKNSPSTSRQNTPQKICKPPQHHENVVRQEVVDEVLLVSTAQSKPAAVNLGDVESEVKVPKTESEIVEENIEPAASSGDLESKDESVANEGEQTSTNSDVVVTEISEEPPIDDSAVASFKSEGETKEGNLQKASSPIRSPKIEGEEAKEIEDHPISEVKPEENLEKSATDDSAIARSVKVVEDETEEVAASISEKPTALENPPIKNDSISVEVGGDLENSAAIAASLKIEDETKSVALKSPKIEVEVEDNLQKSTVDGAAIAGMKLEDEIKDVKEVKLDDIEVEAEGNLQKSTIDGAAPIASLKLEDETKEQVKVKLEDPEVADETTSNLDKLTTDKRILKSPEIEEETKEIKETPVSVSVQDNLEKSAVDGAAVPSLKSESEIKEGPADVSVTKDLKIVHDETNSTLKSCKETKEEIKEELVRVKVEDTLEKSAVDVSAIASSKIEGEIKERPIDVEVTKEDSKIVDETKEIVDSPADVVVAIQGSLEKSILEDSAVTGNETAEVKVSQIKVEVIKEDPNVETTTEKNLAIASPKTNKVSHTTNVIASPKTKGKTKQVAQVPVDVDAAKAKKDSEVESLQSPVTDVSSDEFLDAKDESVLELLPQDNNSAKETSPQELLNTLKTDEGLVAVSPSVKKSNRDSSKPGKESDEEGEHSGGAEGHQSAAV